GPDLGGGDLAVGTGQHQALVAGGLHGAGLVHMDMPAVGTEHSLPGLQRRVDHGQVGLGGPHKKVDPGLGSPAQAADQRPRPGAVLVLPIAWRLFQVGLLQQVQHRLGGALPIIAFKTDHTVSILLARPPAYWYSGNRAVRSATRAATSAFLPAKSKMQSAMQSAITRISSGPMPRVVTAGVPSRTPLVTKGLRFSPGTVFLLAVMCTSSRLCSSSLPVQASSVRSTSIRWLSVPPETSR